MNNSKSHRTWIQSDDNNSHGGITVYTVACNLSEGINADVFAFEHDAYLYLVDQAEGLTDAQRIELVQLAELPDREPFWDLLQWVRFAPHQLSDRITHPSIASQPVLRLMNDFESQRAEKAARFRELAAKHENISTGRHLAARQRLEMIPLGQPILVGHHSEKRHRKDLTRIDEHLAKAKEHHDKAEYFRRRAAAAESNRAIFSDDPDATEKLVDKIERLKQRQGAMKRANQLIRQADREGLADLGFSEETITRLFSQDYAGRVGFPNYALTNNSANIRRLEKRLAAIQNAQDDETTEEQFPGGVRLVDNVEANRLQIFFPEIPSEEIRRELKRNGFHWSPTAGAWQRHRSNRATYLAKLLLTNHTR